MAALRPEGKPGSDDGPSRSGVWLRRAIVAAIGGLVLVFLPIYLWMLWGMAHPGYGPVIEGTLNDGGPPRRITSTVTLQLTIVQVDWSKFVQAVDKFAAKHGLVDDRTGFREQVSELQLSALRYNGKDANLEISRTIKANDPMSEVQVRIDEVDGSAAGERLKIAFENEVIRATGFGG